MTHFQTVASQIELSDDYVYYFGLYLIKKEDGSENASKYSSLKVRSYSYKSESDIAFIWIQRESNLMFTLSSDKEHRIISLSLNVNEP